jgi:hypothetical protein
MTMRYALAILALLAATPAPAAASFALCLVTADRILVASDSRTWQRATDTAGPDNARKVDVRERYVFAMTGAPELMDAWQRTTLRPGESARALAGRVIAAVAIDKTRALEFSFTIARFDTPVDAYMARVAIHATGFREVLQQAGGAEMVAPFVIAHGWDDDAAPKGALLQRLQAELRTRPTEGRMVAMAREALSTAAAHSVKIGGPQHVAVMDQAGARWRTSAADVHWDGTNLTVVSANVTIDSSGIGITPSTIFSTSRAYHFPVTTGEVGLFGMDAGGSGRGMNLTSSWTGVGNYSGGPDIFVSLNAQHLPSSGGTSKSAGLSVGANGTASFLTAAADTFTLTGATTLAGEVTATGVSGDGTGKVLCIKSTGAIGTCDATSLNTSGCTCS